MNFFKIIIVLLVQIIICAIIVFILITYKNYNEFKEYNKRILYNKKNYVNFFNIKNAYKQYKKDWFICKDDPNDEIYPEYYLKSNDNYILKDYFIKMNGIYFDMNFINYIIYSIWFLNQISKKVEV